MNMTYQQTRKLSKMLNGGQWLIFGITVLLLIRIFFIAPAIPQVAKGSDTSIRTSIPNSTTTSLDDLAAIWSTNLRQTLIEIPKEPAKKAPPVPKAPPLKLPGLKATFVERGQAWGLFIDTDGSQRVRRAGTLIGSFEIVSIASGIATLRRNVHRYEIKVPKHKERFSLAPKRRVGKGW